LTLDLALRVLKAALPRPQLSPEQALAIIDYYLKRNRIAKQSHHKTWRRKHKNVQYKPLL
jgi:hypothetical protein